MTLKTQRRLAAEIMGIGENKVRFDYLRLEDISKAITRQDIADLIKEKAINKRITGNSKIKKEKRNRGAGSIKLRVRNRKSKYMAKIRKLRRYILELKEKKAISQDEYNLLRKMAKSGQFKARRYLQEYLTTVMKKTLPKHKDKFGEK
jgi:large subunit ribosomal protein L19e